MSFFFYLKFKSLVKGLLFKIFGSVNSKADAEYLLDYKLKLAHISYSQQGEDLSLIRLFEKKLEKKEKGFYVDIGAFHPKRYSNTYLLYLKGWRGINIEPNKEHYKLFEQLRLDDINVNSSVGLSKDPLTYYEFNTPAINTFDVKQRDLWASRPGFNVINEEKISQNSLSDLLDKYVPNNTTIDFFSIDVEGLDLEVLESNNWEKYRPFSILVEESFYEDSCFNDSLIYQYLCSKGYKLWNIAGGTSIYVIAG